MRYIDNMKILDLYDINFPREFAADIIQFIFDQYT